MYNIHVIVTDILTSDIPVHVHVHVCNSYNMPKQAVSD